LDEIKVGKNEETLVIYGAEIVTDYIDLIIRLREHAENMYVDFLNEAADGLEAQAKRIEELEEINKRMKAAFRVNMLRCFPNMSHEEIDAEIDASILRD